MFEDLSIVYADIRTHAHGCVGKQGGFSWSNGWLHWSNHWNIPYDVMLDLMQDALVHILFEDVWGAFCRDTPHPHGWVEGGSVGQWVGGPVNLLKIE